jgi:hypothetical protein
MAIAFAAYSAIAMGLTFALVLHLSSVVPHDTGDPMLSAAIAGRSWPIGAASVGVMAALSPIVIGYSRIHSYHSTPATPSAWTLVVRRSRAPSLCRLEAFGIATLGI